nr:hypothetical protein [Candidatus Sigynarchaeota archaeon]
MDLSQKNELLCIGIASHLMKALDIAIVEWMESITGKKVHDASRVPPLIETYVRVVKESGIGRIFIEEEDGREDTLQDSCQAPLYDMLRPFIQEFIPVSPGSIGTLDDQGLALLEYQYAQNIGRVLVQRPGAYVFLVGGGHLPEKPEHESPVEFALKLMGIGVHCTYRNFLEIYAENHVQRLETRKQYLKEMIKKNDTMERN